MIIYICVASEMRLHLHQGGLERVSTLGFPSWSDSLRPCFACDAFGPELYMTAGRSAAGLRWVPNTDDAYEQA